MNTTYIPTAKTFIPKKKGSLRKLRRLLKPENRKMISRFYSVLTRRGKDMVTEKSILSDTIRDNVLHDLRNLSSSITPLPSRYFETKYGISGMALRVIVHNLRLGGEPIGSNAAGYYFARTREELEAALSYLRGRALTGLKTYNRLKRIELGSDNPQQLRMFS